jgi:hypothetical protein
VVVQALRIVVTPEGELKTLGSEATRWIATGPRAFREKHGVRTLAFREDARGRITHLFVGDLPVMAFERVGPEDLPPVQLSLFVMSLGVCLITIVFWPVAARVRRHYYITLPEGARVPRPARLVAWLASLGFVLFTVCLVLGLTDPNEVVFGVPLMLRVASAFLLAAALLAVGVLGATGWIWWRRRGSVWGRVGYTIVTCAHRR